jgi:hypothetical protein
MNPSILLVFFSLTASLMFLPTGCLLTWDDVILNKVSHVSEGNSQTSMSISLGCIEKSENKSFSGGYKEEDRYTLL